MAKELVGKQKKLDRNNNNRIDKQDFELLRRADGMAKGGKVTGFKNSGVATVKTNQNPHMS